MTAAHPRDRARDRLAHEAAGSLMDLFILMQSAAFSHWLMFELTFAQARALILLAAHEQLTVGQVARLLDVGKSTASILVQQLVRRGLVDRAPDEADRRVAVVRLSVRGQEIGSGRRRAREAQWKGWMGRLQDRELAALGHGLAALARAAREEMARQEPPRRARAARRTPQRAVRPIEA